MGSGTQKPAEKPDFCYPNSLMNLGYPKPNANLINILGTGPNSNLENGIQNQAFATQTYHYFVE